jgi:prepilin-type N-terminal cleavage/methylation domain-containing protein
MILRRLGLILNREAGRGVAPSETPLQGVRLIHRNQRGFALIELLVALAITGIITSGLTMTIFQLFSGNAQSSSQMTVVRQVQNAGYWISQDVQMGQTITPGAVDGFPLVLSWTDWDGVLNEVTYDLAGEELRRSHSVDGGAPVDALVAQYISSISCEFVVVDKLTLTVTASVGGFRPASETRTYEITPRPGS